MNESFFFFFFFKSGITHHTVVCEAIFHFFNHDNDCQRVWYVASHSWASWDVRPAASRGNVDVLLLMCPSSFFFSTRKVHLGVPEGPWRSLKVLQMTCTLLHPPVYMHVTCGINLLSIDEQQVKYHNSRTFYLLGSDIWYEEVWVISWPSRKVRLYSVSLLIPQVAAAVRWRAQEGELGTLYLM